MLQRRWGGGSVTEDAGTKAVPGALVGEEEASPEGVLQLAPLTPLLAHSRPSLLYLPCPPPLLCSLPLAALLSAPHRLHSDLYQFLSGSRSLSLSQWSSILPSP